MNKTLFAAFVPQNFSLFFLFCQHAKGAVCSRGLAAEVARNIHNYVSISS